MITTSDEFLRRLENLRFNIIDANDELHQNHRYSPEGDYLTVVALFESILEDN